MPITWRIGNTYKYAMKCTTFLYAV